MVPVAEVDVARKCISTCRGALRTQQCYISYADRQVVYSYTDA
jgi:hypothetical protein